MPHTDSPKPLLNGLSVGNDTVAGELEDPERFES